MMCSIFRQLHRTDLNVPVYLYLGLEDSDEENEATKKLDGSQPESLKPVNVPPRQMELLDLHPSDTSSQSLHIVKLPNLVGINTTPYSRANHNLEEEEEYYRGYVHNMIRWRYQTDGDKLKRDEDGNPIRESNTRLVKWSDGSYTLQVGQEVLEMDTLDSSVPVNASGEDKGGSLPGFAGINGYLYVSQKARIRPQKQTDEEIKDDENKEEEKAQPAGTVLECVGPIASRFAPRPSSLASEAHRNLTNAIRQRNVKRARIAEIVTDFDPEKEKLARIKGKDDLEKSRNRKGRRSEGGRRKMNESYLEDDERYEGVNLRKLKTQTMRGRGDYSDDEEMDYGEDSESEEDEWSKNKKRQKGVASAMREKIENKKIGDVENSDSSEEGEIVFGDDDDDEEEGTMFKKKGAAKKSNILDDDDD